jgi:hypothetical protein
MIFSRRTLFGWLAAALSGDLFRELLAQDAPPQAAPAQPNAPTDFATLNFLFREIETAGIIPRMPGLMEAILRERFDRAETDYRQGKRRGVEEQHIADAFNILATGLTVPDYAFTSPRQVRFIRMQIALPVNAKFMEIEEINESVGHEMSPLQAAYVFKALVELKLVSPDFQVPPSAWDQTYESQMESLERAQAARKQAEQRQQGAQPGQYGQYRVTVGSPVGTLRAGAPRETKYKELYDIIAKRITFLTPGDGFEILDRMFTTLGI